MKVYFQNGFGKHHGRDRAGDEISIGKRFKWNNVSWYIPAVYVCKEGLVVDYCIEIETDRIKQFVEKFESFQEEIELLESENPLKIDFDSNVVVNGTKLSRRFGCGLSRIPESCRPEGTFNDTKWQEIMEHYKLDPDKGWVIRRQSYSWDFKKKPVIEALEVKLETQPVPITGLKFKSREKGEKIVFTHPVTRMEHVVTIQDIEERELDVESLQNEEYEYPRHYTTMSYTLSPELPNGEFVIYDCLQSDSPKRKQTGKATGACSIGIIGVADGPTAIFFAGKLEESKLHNACSALHFEPVDEVEWKMVHRIKMGEDIAVELI